ncbi:hypothetical protein BGX27_006097 [Mortierella sp. AM989]|nr:hypothetical protein BGX27_006097 [Mortierella sp. AM989]
MPSQAKKFCSFQMVEGISRENLGIDHVHSAIIYEVRDGRNWDNALKLFTTYLAPVVLASQKAAAAAGSTPVTLGNNNYSRRQASKIIDFEEKENGEYTTLLNAEDLKLIKYSVAAMVRYAPSQKESNIVYMFYLQCDPPIRDDESIDNCLVSLIYKYAQDNDPEVKKKGLQLIEVALNRGIGLPDYKEQKSKKNSQYARPQPRDPQNTILASVSAPILRLLKLQISGDGRTLEARSSSPYRDSYGQPRHQQQQFQDNQRPQNQHPRIQQQQQQQQQQHRQHHHQPQNHQQQPQNQQQHRPPQQQDSQQQHSQPQPRNPQQHRAPQQSQSQQHQPRGLQQHVPRYQQHQHQLPPGSKSYQGQNMNQIERGPNTPQHLQDNKVANQDANTKEPGTTGTPAPSVPEDEMNPYDNSKRMSRRGFEGFSRDGYRGGRGGFTGNSSSSSRVGGYGGANRTVAFVLSSESSNEVKDSAQAPANANAASKEHHSQEIQDPSPELAVSSIIEREQQSQDPSLSLAAEVERLQLEPQSSDKPDI